METQTLYDEAYHLIQTVFGPQAHFRSGQWEAIEALITHRERVLVVQKTGWGKSLVYFIATRLIRNQQRGCTVLISPLLSLMRNQLEAADKLGLRAETINSTNRDRWDSIEQALLDDKIDLLLISPERLGNEHFQAHVWRYLSQKVGLVAIDEAHCVSDWGHDFRPDYRRIIRILDDLPPHTPVLGTTATANNRVVADVAVILGVDMHIQRGELTRQSLELYVVEPVLSQGERLVLLTKLLRRIQGSGIIYCSTTHDCDLVAEWLQKQGFAAKPYHSDVENRLGESREDLEQQLLRNKVKALVASVALGMGFDKPDLHFVIHYQHPDSIISYYQQIGRAGRGIDNAKIILMHGHEDISIQQYFIETAFPKPHLIDKTIAALGHHPLTIPQLQKAVNAKKTTLERVLLHLEIEQIVERSDQGYQLTGKKGQPDYGQWAQVTAQRQRELGQMTAYISHDGCLMQFIAQALDDPTHAQPCGRCQNCTDKHIRSNPSAEEMAAVQHFLTREQFITIEPRKMFPSGGIGDEAKGKIPFPNQRGVALCFYRAGGWSNDIEQGLQTGTFSTSLVEASATLIEKAWLTWNPKPQWVTCVPSRRKPTLVPLFAEALAKRLKLPFYAVVSKSMERPPQQEMLNSYKQAVNIWGVFQIAASVENSPVLLVDDLIQSGWTLAITGFLLQKAGSGPVYPFALAKG